MTLLQRNVSEASMRIFCNGRDYIILRDMLHEVVRDYTGLDGIAHIVLQVYVQVVRDCPGLSRTISYNLVLGAVCRLSSMFRLSFIRKSSLAQQTRLKVHLSADPETSINAVSDCKQISRAP